MTRHLTMATDREIRPKITVIGVGGAGGNAVNNMIAAKLEGVEFIIANTDAQAMEQSLVESSKRLQLGPSITQGLGAGSKPDVGRAAAEESSEELVSHLRGSNMVFITAGMGGGTGTGAAPIIACAAREAGILTVGVVTKPFHFEGIHRMRTAERGIEDLQQYVDTLIIIPNQNLFRVANERTTFADAFKMADDVLYSGVRGVTDLMIMPGLINLDFADIRAVMAEMGKAMMGTGEAEGARRALDAAEAAISNPLLDDVSMKGAKGVLINITGGFDMTLYEVDEAANRIRDEVDPEANIIFGSTFDEKLSGRLRVSVVATGIGQTSLLSQGQASAAWGSSIAAEESMRKGEYGEHFMTRGSEHPAELPQTEEGTSGYTMATSHESTDFTIKPAGQPLAEGEGRELSSEFPAMMEDVALNEQLDRVSMENERKELEDSPLENEEKEYPLQTESKRRTASLFERFTGVTRNRVQQHPVTEATLKKNQKTTEETSVQTPKLEGAEEDDLLSIPAFLRRGGSGAV